MDNGKVIHDLAMACSKIGRTGGVGVLVKETVDEYLKLAKTIRERIEETRD